MAEIFRFRPAPLRGPVDWRVDGDRLLTPDGPLPLAEVTDARLTQATIRGSRMRRLDLARGKAVTRIGISIGARAGATDPDLAAHRALCTAVAERLAARRPDLLVTVGEARGTRWAYFAIGALSTLAGLGIPLAALASGVDGDRLWAAGTASLLLLLFGLVVAAGNLPWQTLPRIPVATVPELLARLDQDRT